MSRSTQRLAGGWARLSKATPAIGLSACVWLALAATALFSRPDTRAATQELSRGGAPGSEAPRRLVLGRREEREICPGEQQLYEISLNAGQFARVILDEAGVDLTGSFCPPDGGGCVEFRGRSRAATAVSVIARATGSYRLTIRARESAVDVLGYEVSLGVVRPSAVSDEGVVEAERLFAKAERLRAEWTAGASRGALEKYGDARELLRKAGDRREEAATLLASADALLSLAEPRQALTHYDAALSISRAAGDALVESDALNGIGSVHLTVGENQKAMRYFLAAQEVSRRALYRRGEARSHNLVGEVYNALGDMRASLDWCLKALALWRELGDAQGQALALLNAGHAHSSLSNIQNAEESFAQSLRLWQGADNVWGAAHTLTAMGHLKSKLGEKQDALNLYNQALPLFHRLGDKVGTAYILNGMGYVYDELGEKETALTYHGEALQLFRSADYRDGEAGALLRIGEVHYSQKDNHKALDYFQQALTVYRTLGFKLYESYALRDMGMAYEALGEPKKALEHYRRALAVNRVSPDRRWQAYTINNIAHVYERAGDKRAAQGYYEQALALNRATGDRFGAASTLYNIARVERDLGHLNEARGHAEEVLQMAESLRTEVASQALRASYFASAQQYYELCIDILMRLHGQRPAEGYAAAAFEFSEWARARSLVESIKEAQTHIRPGAPPELRERQRVLRRELSAKAERRMQLPAGSRGGEEEQALNREIDRLTVEYDEISSQIKSADPRYASLTQPQPLGLKEIQRQVLDEDVLLLEYFLGEEKSYLWAVTSTEITAHVLPPRAEVEEAARRFYEILVEGRSAAGVRPEARRPLPAEQYEAQALALSRMVLGPVADRLSVSRLLIASDGALQYVPFQALTLPVAEHSGEAIPLVVTHEIVYEPSASSLAVLRGEARRREPAPKAVAVFADPVFEKDDQRLPQQGGLAVAAAHSATPNLELALRDVDMGGGDIMRLLASQDEAEAIVRAAPRGSVFKAIGFDANRSTVLNTELDQYRIVHFATHGLLDTKPLCTESAEVALRTESPTPG